MTPINPLRPSLASCGERASGGLCRPVAGAREFQERGWTAEPYLIAGPCEPVKVNGFTYRGLGMKIAVSGSPAGKRKPIWVLTHLGSGHRIVAIKADARDACIMATEIADAGDWTFDGITGWKNQFPDAPDRLADVVKRYSKAILSGGGFGSSEDAARRIVMSRS